MARKRESESLENDLLDIMSYMRLINRIQDGIKEKYGIGMMVMQIGGAFKTGIIVMRNGIEEAAKALGEEPKHERYFGDSMTFRHYGVDFTQYADDKTKHFTKANEEKPKVEYV